MSTRRQTRLAAPHRQIEAQSPRERILVETFDALWVAYEGRVPHVQTYEKVVAAAGASFVNDHIAFRTIAAEKPATGIATLSRIFESLGYEPAGTYVFPDKHLASIHYQHPRAGMPKLFISELRSWEFDAAVQRAILRTLAPHRPLATDRLLSKLAHAQTPADVAALVRAVTPIFLKRPWPAPEKKDVLAVHEATQFGAWVLLHGYAVNHFTALVNSHGTASLADIDKTVDAMRAAGVPMKTEIEGAPGSKLRQTATEAASSQVAVREQGRARKITWPYAYFEIAERGNIVDPATGQRQRFEGFLGPQATQLFEMTRAKS